MVYDGCIKWHGLITNSFEFDWKIICWDGGVGIETCKRKNGGRGKCAMRRTLGAQKIICALYVLLQSLVDVENRTEVLAASVAHII